MDNKMKCISLWQPWASLVVLGEKQNETRSWPTNFRGTLAIHAAKKPWNQLPFMGGGFLAYLHRALSAHRIDLYFLPRGSIIGTVEIIDCVPVESLYSTLAEQERAFGDYSRGRYAWKLANPVMFNKPIPCKGQQGFWTVELMEGL
jgi:hypothetical protein